MAEPILLALKCPSCGAPLRINQTIDTFACSYCGGSVQVERGGGIVSLHLLEDAMLGVQRGTDRTAAELAIRRLTDELAALEGETQKLAGQREAVQKWWEGRIATLANQSNIVALAVIGAVASLFSFPVVRAIFWWFFSKLDARAGQFAKLSDELPAPYDEMRLLVSWVLIACICFLVWRRIRRGQMKVLAKEKSAQTEAFAKQDLAEGTLRSRIAVTAAKLKVQRQLVD